MSMFRTTINGKSMSLFDNKAEADKIAAANTVDAEDGDVYKVVMAPNGDYAIAFINDFELIGYL